MILSSMERRKGILTIISQNSVPWGWFLSVYDDRSRDDMPAGTDYSGTWNGWDYPWFQIGPEYQTENGKFGSGVAVSSGITEEGGNLILQVGPATEDILRVRLPDTSTWSLGIGQFQPQPKLMPMIPYPALKMRFIISAVRGDAWEHTRTAWNILSGHRLRFITLLPPISGDAANAPDSMFLVLNS